MELWLSLELNDLWTNTQRGRALSSRLSSTLQHPDRRRGFITASAKKAPPPFPRLAPLCSGLRKRDYRDKSFLCALKMCFSGQRHIPRKKRKPTRYKIPLPYPILLLLFSFNNKSFSALGLQILSQLWVIYSPVQGEFQAPAFPPLGTSALVLTFSVLTSMPDEGKQWGGQFSVLGYP